MATDLQIAANRTNSLKSTGPSSPEGREISSRNSLRHGILANTIVLDNESADRFSLLLSTMHEDFEPQIAVEYALIETMAVARWRQMRLWGVEKACLNFEMKSQQLDPEQSDVSDQDAATRVAHAYRRLSDQSRSMDNLNRYEARFERQYVRALDRLILLREKKSNSAKRSQFAELD